MDVSEILAELKTIGAIDAPKEPEVVIPESVAVERPVRLPAEPVSEILKALETIRSNLMLLVGQQVSAPVAEETRETKSKTKLPRKTKRDLAHEAAVPAPVVAGAVEEVVNPALPTLEEARRRALAKIRGDDLPKAAVAADEEADLPYVGYERAKPIDLRHAESVGNREALANYPQ